MDTHFELLALQSGNVIADCVREEDAIDALIEVATNRGLETIPTFALTRVMNGTPVLTALPDDLVARVERELPQVVMERRDS